MAFTGLFASNLESEGAPSSYETRLQSMTTRSRGSQSPPHRLSPKSRDDMQDLAPAASRKAVPDHQTAGGLTTTGEFRTDLHFVVKGAVHGTAVGNLKKAGNMRIV